MKFLLPVVITIALLALSMHTLLQFIPWEVAMRYIGITISILSAAAGVIYLPKEATID